MNNPPPAHKVAIPRIGGFASQQERKTSRDKPDIPRTDKACLKCRKRKVRCTGEQPQCQSCLDQQLSCVYAQARKDRLKNATDQNNQLLALLRDLSHHVDEAGRKRIDELFDSLGEEIASLQQFQQWGSLGKRSRLHSMTTESTADASNRHGEAEVSGSTGSNENLDLLDEDLLRSKESRATGYVGQNSEVQWLRSLKTQLANASSGGTTYNLPYGPPGSSKEAVDLRAEAWKGRRQASKLNNLLHVTGFTFYLDSDDLDVDVVVDPYELPQPDEARMLFGCYMNTVHSSFPIISKAFEEDFYKFNSRMEQRQPCDIPQKWQAIINLVFAIGAQFLHLTQTSWQTDERKHLIYMTRAVRILGLDKAPIFLSAPDLPLIQATGLLSLYYLVIGHASRAWVMIGISLRFALAAGLHLRNEDPNANQYRKEHLVRTWWSLHSIETLLCAIIGRPCVIPNDECTVPLPQVLPGEQADDASRTCSKAARHSGMTNVTMSRNPSQESRDEPERPRTPSFLVARVTIAIIMQKALSKLYSPRTASGSWEKTQKDIASLTEELDAWAITALPNESNSGTRIEPFITREQLLLAFQYHSTRLLISRPCLCRLERRIRGQSNTSAVFNNKTAEACVQAAQAIAKLLPDQPDLSFVYQQGPWWCIVHNIMQAIAVFLLEMSFGESHMTHNGKEIPKSTKKLLRWLQEMSITNAVAERAYKVAIDIIKTGAPRVRIDISDILAEEARGPDPSHIFSSSQTSNDFPFPSHHPPSGDFSMGFPKLLDDAASQGAHPPAQQFLPPDPQYLMLDPEMQLPLSFGNPFMTNFDQPDLLEEPEVFDPGSYSG